jgi:hypothetical protein
MDNLPGYLSEILNRLGPHLLGKGIIVPIIQSVAHDICNCP